MKTPELEQLTVIELQKRLEESRRRLYGLKEGIRSGTVRNYKQLSVAKKDIARIKTVLQQKLHGQEGTG